MSSVPYLNYVQLLKMSSSIAMDPWQRLLYKDYIVDLEVLHCTPDKSCMEACIVKGDFLHYGCHCNIEDEFLCSGPIKFYQQEQCVVQCSVTYNVTSTLMMCINRIKLFNIEICLRYIYCLYICILTVMNSLFTLLFLFQRRTKIQFAFSSLSTRKYYKVL